MKKLNCIFILIAACRICSAQNLVPNSGFEQYTICPMSFGEISDAAGWYIPLFSTTPDYFNACTPNLNVDVPQNLCGYEAARSGNAYAGIVTFHIQQQTTNQKNYREYIQCQLNDSLIAGVSYCISWYVSACDSCNYVCNNMGMFFSDIQINDTCMAPNPCNLNYLPQVENPPANNLNNRNGWTPVSGTYIAAGGEKYIIIGNFSDTTGTTGTYTGWASQSGSDLDYLAFYFIDDVLVAPCDSLTGFNEGTLLNQCTVYPDPFSDKINIIVNGNENLELSLFDFTYRKLVQKKFITKVTISADHLSNGIYLYEVRNKGRVIKKGKLIKE